MKRVIIASYGVSTKVSPGFMGYLWGFFVGFFLFVWFFYTLVVGECIFGRIVTILPGLRVMSQSTEILTLLQKAVLRT